MFKHRRKIMAILAAILALLMLLSVVVMMFPGVQATPEQDLADLKKKANALTTQKKSLQSELSTIRSQKKNASREKENLDRQIEVLDEQIETSTQLIEALEADIAQKVAEIEAATADEDAEYALFKRRIRGMEESSHQSEWAVLLGAESFSEFLSKAEVISDIIRFNRSLMQRLKEARERIEAAKAILEEDHTYYAAVLVDFEEQRVEAEAKKVEQESFIKNLEADEALTAAELAELVKEEEAAAKEIDRLAKELAKRKTYVGGAYIWPLPAGVTNITSKFGMRTHPVTRKYSLHTGTDIGAAKGTEIYAANAGTVIVATYSSSWGNYVMIDHGGGNVTLYAHMSSIKTKLNAEVKQGAVIGYVGSTGWSTGPHLHFEMRKDGVPYDPMTVFKAAG